jgi:hypothetical protein
MGRQAHINDLFDHQNLKSARCLLLCDHKCQQKLTQRSHPKEERI